MTLLHDVHVFSFCVNRHRCAQQNRQTLCKQPLSGHSTILGQGKSHTHTEAQAQPSGKSTSNKLLGAGSHKVFHQSDVIERRTPFHTHFTPVSGFVIVFGEQPAHAIRCSILFSEDTCCSPRFSAGSFFLQSFLQCLRLFLPFLHLLMQAASSLLSACDGAPEANTSSGRARKSWTPRPPPLLSFPESSNACHTNHVNTACSRHRRSTLLQ